MKGVFVFYFVCFLSSVVLTDYDGKGGCGNGDCSKKRFSINKRLVSYHQGHQNCLSEGRKLASILTYAEQKDLENTLINAGVFNAKLWIGANDQRSEGEFRWIGDRHPPVRFTNWAVDQPNNTNNEDCVAVVQDYRWDDRNCDEKLGYICEYYGEEDEE